MQGFLTEVPYCPIQIYVCLLSLSLQCRVKFSLLPLFPFWDTGLLCHVTQVGLDPIILLDNPEYWDCWCGCSCLAVIWPSLSLGVCRCVSLCFLLCFSAQALFSKLYIFLWLRLERLTLSLNIQFYSLWSWPQQCFQVDVGFLPSVVDCSRVHMYKYDAEC